MLFTLSLLRFNDETMQFQNTEFNGFILSGQVEEFLIKKNAPESVMESYMDMKKSESKTFDFVNGSHRYFFYLNRIN